MGDKAQAFIRQIFRFNIIGVLNTGITYGIYALLVWLGIHYIVALISEYCFGVVFSFFMNKRFTFNDRRKTNLRMLGRMILTYLIVLGMNFILLRWFIESFGMSEYLGQFFALSISVAFSFGMQKLFVFGSLH